MFKFDIIVDVSFCRLNERMMVSDSFSVSSFAKTAGSNRNGRLGKVTKNGHQNFAECLAGSLSSSPGRLQYLQIATSWLKFQMSPKLLTLARVIFVYNKRSHQLSWTVWIQTGLSMIAKESWNDHRLSSNIMTVWTGRKARDVSFRNS